MAKTKLPKQIAGVKVPKKIRKKGDKLIAAAEQHPIFAELAASALLAAAAALRDGDNRRAIKSEASEMKARIKAEGSELKAAIKTAARDALRHLSVTLAESADEIRADAPEAAPAPAPPEKPRSPKKRRKAK